MVRMIGKYGGSTIVALPLTSKELDDMFGDTWIKDNKEGYGIEPASCDDEKPKERANVKEWDEEAFRPSPEEVIEKARNMDDYLCREKWKTWRFNAVRAFNDHVINVGVLCKKIDKLSEISVNLPDFFDFSLQQKKETDIDITEINASISLVKNIFRTGFYRLDRLKEYVINPFQANPFPSLDSDKVSIFIELNMKPRARSTTNTKNYFQNMFDVPRALTSPTNEEDIRWGQPFLRIVQTEGKSLTELAAAFVKLVGFLEVRKGLPLEPDVIAAQPRLTEEGREIFIPKTSGILKDVVIKTFLKQAKESCKTSQIKWDENMKKFVDYCELERAKKLR